MKLFSSILMLALALNPSSSVALADPADVDYRRVNPEVGKRSLLQPKVSSPSDASRLEATRRSPSALPTVASAASRFTVTPKPEVRRDYPRLSPPVRDGHNAAPASPLTRSFPVVRPAATETRLSGFAKKYQRHLGSSDAVHIGRTPSLARDGTARLNRFVFRRTKPSAADESGDVVRAGGALSARR